MFVGWFSSFLTFSPISNKLDTRTAPSRRLSWPVWHTYWPRMTLKMTNGKVLFIISSSAICEVCTWHFQASSTIFPYIGAMELTWLCHECGICLTLPGMFPLPAKGNWAVYSWRELWHLLSPWSLLEKTLWESEILLFCNIFIENFFYFFNGFFFINTYTKFHSSFTAEVEHYRSVKSLKLHLLNGEFANLVKINKKVRKFQVLRWFIG